MGGGRGGANGPRANFDRNSNFERPTPHKTHPAAGLHMQNPPAGMVHGVRNGELVVHVTVAGLVGTKLVPL